MIEQFLGAGFGCRGKSLFKSSKKTTLLVLWLVSFIGIWCCFTFAIWKVTSSTRGQSKRKEMRAAEKRDRKQANTEQLKGQKKDSLAPEAVITEVPGTPPTSTEADNEHAEKESQSDVAQDTSNCRPQSRVDVVAANSLSDVRNAQHSPQNKQPVEVLHERDNGTGQNLSSNTTDSFLEKARESCDDQQFAPTHTTTQTVQVSSNNTESYHIPPAEYPVPEDEKEHFPSVRKGNRKRHCKKDRRNERSLRLPVGSAGSPTSQEVGYLRRHTNAWTSNAMKLAPQAAHDHQGEKEFGRDCPGGIRAGGPGECSDEWKVDAPSGPRNIEVGCQLNMPKNKTNTLGNENGPEQVRGTTAREESGASLRTEAAKKTEKTEKIPKAEEGESVREEEVLGLQTLGEQDKLREEENERTEGGMESVG
eukprot:CAMPEP_0181314040 /NCGR_PEP_ID=MMETSP1101-20121128/14590_1 /TAXON_ID=46948 /ORGANISM="Rhodomonas abbreviata, Strain Caron Lab Isolate" /LENGTH=419 /DNA_ID=CAMNT_0023421075 /DNA_START=275 /DNA_END=1530 /DNA_ORIENTATION=+